MKKKPKFIIEKAQLAGRGLQAHAREVNELGGTLVGVTFDHAKWNAELAKYAPGCGAPTHVAGTNGGTMPCGAKLTMLGKTEPYFCGHCEKDMKQ